MQARMVASNPEIMNLTSEELKEMGRE